MSIGEESTGPAKRSRLGVLVWECPPRQPIQSFRSSIAMNKTLGDFSPQRKPTPTKLKKRKSLIFFTSAKLPFLRFPFLDWQVRRVVSNFFQFPATAPLPKLHFFHSCWKFIGSINILSRILG